MAEVLAKVQTVGYGVYEGRDIQVVLTAFRVNCNGCGEEQLALTTESEHYCEPCRYKRFCESVGVVDG